MPCLSVPKDLTHRWTASEFTGKFVTIMWEGTITLTSEIAPRKEIQNVNPFLCLPNTESFVLVVFPFTSSLHNIIKGTIGYTRKRHLKIKGVLGRICQVFYPQVNHILFELVWIIFQIASSLVSFWDQNKLVNSLTIPFYTKIKL